MNPSKVYQSIGKTVANYRAKLAHIDEDTFTKTPPNGGWSYSEVYSHIFDASLLSLIALYKTNQDEGENKPTPFAVKLILLFGTFPPAQRYKVPERMVRRVKKISKLTAEQFITDFELQLAKNYPPVKDANPNSKIKHPRMGYLNSKQWLRFIDIHLKHHLKQLNRIQKNFQQS